MNTRNRIFIFIVPVVIAAAALFGGAALVSISGTSSVNAGANAASSTVAAFGTHLNDVSLLAPNASSTIASVYEPYVTPELLTAWEANPTSAPGRSTSSRWPDHIQIDSIAAQGSSYVINGHIVLMTSNEVEHGGNAGTVPVVVQVIQQDATWRIAAYQQEQTQ